MNQIYKQKYFKLISGAKAYARGTPEEKGTINALMLSLMRLKNKELVNRIQLPNETAVNVGNMLPLTIQEKKDIIEKKQELLRRNFLNNDGSLNRVPVNDIFVNMNTDIIYLNNFSTNRRFTNDDLELFFAMLKLSPVFYLYLHGNLIYDVRPLMNALPQSVRAIWLNCNIINDTELLNLNNRPNYIRTIYYSIQNIIPY